MKWLRDLFFPPARCHWCRKPGNINDPEHFECVAEWANTP
jgi:hypothetical protein